MESTMRVFPLPAFFAGPKDLFLEGTAQLFRGDSGNPITPVFRASDNKDVSVVGHFRGYKDLSESTNLDIGFSYARGHNDTGAAFSDELVRSGYHVALEATSTRRLQFPHVAKRVLLEQPRSALRCDHVGNSTRVRPIQFAELPRQPPMDCGGPLRS